MPQQLIEYQGKEEPASEPLRAMPHVARSETRNVTLIIAQLVRFAMVGGLNTCIDLVCFNVLLWLWPTQSTLLLLVYNSLAYACGGINSFLLHKYWTFQCKHCISRREVVTFLLTMLAGISCNDLIIGVASSLMHPFPGNPTLWANTAKVIAVFGTMCISYVGMRLWVFVRPEATIVKER